MTDVSGRLRAARERAGLTVEDLSARTKIKPTFLQAIERGEFEQLPGEFFVRAFLRTYAREVHLSPDEIVAVYDTRYRSADNDKPPAFQSQRVVTDLAFESRRALTLPSRSVWPTIALAGAILIVLSVINRSTPDTATEPRPAGTTGVAEAAVPPAVPRPTRKASEKLTIEIRPVRVLWVACMADGKRVIYRLVEPTERVRIDAQQDLWFRVGDAGAFVYSINGSPAKPLGAPGEVREFTITRQNLAAFAR